MKAKKVFFCSDCGNETPSWQGRCTACGAWNTIVEMAVDKPRASSSGGGSRAASATSTRGARQLDDLRVTDETRFKTRFGEFDRVLGGGAVEGSLVLVGGAPGIGKSTLMLQICGQVSEKTKVLYVSGEESERQIKLRAERLGVAGANIFILTETDVGEVVAAAEEAAPSIMIVDSIQTLYNPELTSAPGSVGQVKDCAMSLLRLSKSTGITVFLIGHVNKEGAIAGPMVLEHMVDCVLQFEGERQTSFRVLRAKKNRFGSTNEIGVFEMTDEGLAEVSNPSEQMLSGRPENTPGTCVTCVLEGTRPILAEIQALVAPSTLSVPRRNATGIDYNRALMLLAVLEKRGGVRVSGCDAYLNVIGGLNLEEPGADLATVLAVASSYRDKPVGDDLVAVGEVGLTGELRAVAQTDLRLTEAARLGFTRCVLPSGARGHVTPPKGLQLIFVKNVAEALRVLDKG
ncbi:MAG: DNA repair protein RadA [Oscillospiraceae bacterium]|jgi:DNA repair protein RadA/Sms|nr:DNA repair protein RadA [Oscillospiraceae bacterium]